MPGCGPGNHPLVTAPIPSGMTRAGDPLVLTAMLLHPLALAAAAGGYAAITTEDDDAIGVLLLAVVLAGAVCAVLALAARFLQQRRRGELAADRLDGVASVLPPPSGLPRGTAPLLWLLALVPVPVVAASLGGAGAGVGLQVGLVSMVVDVLGLLGGYLVALLVVLPLVLLLPAPRHLPPDAADRSRSTRAGVALVLLPILPLAVALVLAEPDLEPHGNRDIGALVVGLVGADVEGGAALAWLWTARLMALVIGCGIALLVVGARRTRRRRQHRGKGVAAAE